MIGRTISHYLVEESLGAGGMGAVYRARDLALGRQAAIKVVAGTYDESLQRRLVREAEANARLQHPAIATFYESGESDGHAFIAMEYVRGRSLRDRLANGPLPMAEAASVASAMLEALNHAHAAGILHRDIKPENIMLGESGSSTSASRGSRCASRKTAAERIASILGREPDVSGAIPAPLGAVVSRALAKRASDRYASASEMLAALRAVAAGGPSVPLPQTIAVVDLKNLSGQGEHDWIGSGIAESVTIDLARVPGLTVVAREKVLRAARAAAADGRTPDAIEVGRILGCRWALSGSFQCIGKAVRITTAMTDVATGAITAGEKLDGSIDGIFELQDRLAVSVARRLDLTLPGAAAPMERDVEAFELHARGRRLWLRLEKGTFDEAAGLYRRAIEADPAYAPALSSLAALHAMRFTFTTDPGELQQAADYARRAIAADPSLADPHVWLGYAFLRQGQMDEALAEERRAAELEPDLAFAWYFAGTVEGFRARPLEAIPLFQRAVAIDPLHGFAWMGLGGAHLAAGNLDEARWCVERAVALEGKPGSAATAGVSVYLGECLRAAGDLPAARRACLDGIEAAERSDHMYRDSYRGIGLCVLARTALDQGDVPAARAALHQLLAHVAGRERTLGGGHLAVQAMAGIARAGEGATWLDDALQLFEKRDRYNFSLMWGADDGTTLFELARAAAALDRPEAAGLLRRARAAGSVEARRVLDD